MDLSQRCAPHSSLQLRQLVPSILPIGIDLERSPIPMDGLRFISGPQMSLGQEIAGYRLIGNKGDIQLEDGNGPLVGILNHHAVTKALDQARACNFLSVNSVEAA